MLEIVCSSAPFTDTRPEVQLSPNSNGLMILRPVTSQHKRFLASGITHI